ncbi:MAG: WecB/TagA/CpsF family glycosyltransferase [Thermoguttaceae bacterium]|nr:WecB/TagA/CpsF family glycosyltransferase [Thermoguttaceae bacterium]
MATDANERTRVLGVPVDALTMATALERAVELAKDRTTASYAVAINPEKTFAIRRSAELAQFVENAALALPDGVGVVWASRLLNGRKIERVPGADLAEAVCARSGAEGLNLFFYGAKEEASVGAVAELRRRYPDIRVVGRRNGYVKAEEMDALTQEIADSNADVLLVALGSPRQERWIAEHAARTKVGLCLGVGGTLDTFAGTVKRAPLAWQKMNLEWFYRLLKQPSRIWRCRLLAYFVAEVFARRLFVEPFIKKENKNRR